MSQPLACSCLRKTGFGGDLQPACRHDFNAQHDNRQRCNQGKRVAKQFVHRSLYEQRIRESSLQDVDDGAKIPAGGGSVGPRSESANSTEDLTADRDGEASQRLLIL